jgi:hypothetical protein
LGVRRALDPGPGARFGGIGILRRAMSGGTRRGLHEVADPRSIPKNLWLTSGAFDALQRAGHVALAFGTPIPAPPGRYFDLDLVAMAIAAGLAPTLRRQTATTTVLGFFNQWVAAVGHADADTARNYFFAMGVVGWDNDERRPREIWVTNGTMEQITSDLRDPSSVIAVNITDIIARLRTKARTAGIDLSQAFFFPPEHERFSQIITELEQEREGASLAFGEVKRKCDDTKH